MSSRLNPYFVFNGNAREAMEFYETVFGGTLTVNTFGEFGGDPAIANNVMHAMLETTNGYTLMASDLGPNMPYNPGDNISISLSGEDADDLRGYWEKLSEAGTITLPLDKQVWGDEFGACVDRFGIAWMVNIVGPKP